MSKYFCNWLLKFISIIICSSVGRPGTIDLNYFITYLISISLSPLSIFIYVDGFKFLPERGSGRWTSVSMSPDRSPNSAPTAPRKLVTFSMKPKTFPKILQGSCFFNYSAYFSFYCWAYLNYFWSYLVCLLILSVITEIWVCISFVTY